MLKCKRLASTVFVTVHSDRTAVVSLHKQSLPVSDCWHLTLSKHLALSLILSPLSQIVYTLLWASLTLCHMSTIRSPFWSQLIMSNFPFIPLVFCQVLTWIALDDVDFRFSLNANAVEEETKWPTWLYHQRNQFIRVTDGVKVISLSASLLQKIGVAKSRETDIFEVTWGWNYTKRNRVKQDVLVLVPTFFLPFCPFTSDKNKSYKLLD